MREILLPAAVVTAYVGLLMAVALGAERLEARGLRIATNRFVYSLSLAVYATTWTFYGSVGFAARTGVLFLTVYLGPTLAFVAGWWIVRKLVRIKNTHGVTGLPDLLSVFYEKSHAVALLATVVLVVGLVPYVALQLKTMIATLALVSGAPGALAYPAAGKSLGPPLVVLMLLFTIAFGLRRLRPTERHPGMVVAIAVECVVKLVAFLAVGAYVTFVLFDGFGDVFRAASVPSVGAPELLGGLGVSAWLSHLLLSAFAVLLLPRQFHVAVVENSDEDHIRTAMWLFPAYLLAINVFVLPLALGALALHASPEAADTFVLTVPMNAGEPMLTWFVFLGGFSAGVGMVVVETTALATMISNHVAVPAAEAWRPLRGLRRHVLPVRWAAAGLVLVAAFGFERAFGADYSLVSIGFISFAAVLQLAPAVLGGLFWPGASRRGALLGLSAGFGIWLYTVVVPVLARASWLPPSIVEQGPFGIAALLPEGLAGLQLDPISHVVLWTVLVNAGAFALGSVLWPPSAEESARTETLRGALEGKTPGGDADAQSPVISPVETKRALAIALLAAYLGEHQAMRSADDCLARVGAGAREGLTALQLADFEAEVERALAAAVGTAAAHAAVRRSGLVSEEEALAVSRAYAEVLALLHVAPSELRRKIDYHRERERLLARDAETQRFLAGVSGLLGASLRLDDIARAAVRLPLPRLGDAALLLAEPGAAEPWRAWFAGAADDEREIDEAAELAAAPAIARALGARRPSLARPVDPRAWPAALRSRLPLAGEVVVPILASESAIGALALFEAEARLTPEDVTLAEELARRVALTMENARLFAQSEQAVHARDRAFAVASHELKSPLGPLRLRLQMLERLVARGSAGEVSPEKLAQLFGGAEGQVLRLAGLVDDLLDTTRITAHRLHLSRETMDLSSMAREVVERHRADLEEGVRAIHVDAPDPVTGHWDRLRLERVLTNLLTNAAKYAPGSEVRVEVRSVPSQARLVVKDDGPGIPPRDRDRVFLPFERAGAPDSVAGLGLGLFVVRQIVEAHGGTIRLETSSGLGATFTIDLPRDDAPDPRPADV